jgi:RNA polymerase sigma-70 factor (ECF subfamily)
MVNYFEMSANLANHSNRESISLQDSKSFQQFYNRNLMNVFRFIYGLHGGPVEEVEDLTAETFLRAWKSRHQFSGSEPAVLGWLLRIARNLVIDTYRRQKNRGFPEDIEQHIVQSNSQNPEEQAVTREQIKVLWSLLYTLSDLQREILVLRYILGWRVQDIGNHLDMKENTVSVYISRAINRLRHEWPR